MARMHVPTVIHETYRRHIIAPATYDAWLLCSFELSVLGLIQVESVHGLLWPSTHYSHRQAMMLL